VRALITGGAGFIGSHLADRLLADGGEVWVIDNLSTGSFANIAHLKDHPRFHYTIDTIANEPLLAELVDQAEVVFHLAAAVGVKLIVEQPVHTIETNVHGTEVVLKHANKKKKLVVVASTSEVYGKSVDLPFREDADLTLGPTCRHRWSYACSKLIDEFLALAYWKEKKLPVVVVRLFNTVGPRQTGQYGMVIPTFVQQALAERPDAVAVVRAITELASALGMETTAEGVEDSEQLERIKAHGCTSVQGFLFSRPVTADKVPGLLVSSGTTDSSGRKVA
jgi:UDP-glucose 4-epimerase